MKSKEAKEQEVVIMYCRYKRIDIFAIPNGGSRNIIEASNLKKQGVMAGIPDLFIPLAKRLFHGLFLEMKVKPNRPTENQKFWIEKLKNNGYKVEVCYNANEAIKVIEKYVK